jgi:hypothetical protein
VKLTEAQLDQHEASVMEARGNAALANGRALEARRLFRIADALRANADSGHAALQEARG